MQMRRFQIRTTNYIFDAAEERDDDFQCVNIYIGHPEKYTKACVFITIEDNSDTAILQNAMYQVTCAKTMLQCSIKYVFDTYLSVQSISINDKSMVPTTAKRLLQGRMGWYQEALHAIPDPSHKQTMFLMKELQSTSVKKRIAENLDITSKKTGEHIKTLKIWLSKFCPRAQSTWLELCGRFRDIHVNAIMNLSKVAVAVLPREEKQRAIRKLWHM